MTTPGLFAQALPRCRLLFNIVLHYYSHRFGTRASQAHGVLVTLSAVLGFTAAAGIPQVPNHSLVTNSQPYAHVLLIVHHPWHMAPEAGMPVAACSYGASHLPGHCAVALTIPLSPIHSQ